METKTLPAVAFFLTLFLATSIVLAAPTAPSKSKTPNIKTLSPNTGGEGEVITMAGSNFGKDPADGIIGLNDGPNYVRVGGFLGTDMISWANNKVQIFAPSLQDAASNLSRMGIFFTVADSIGKNIPGFNLFLYTMKLFDAVTTQKSTFVDNTAPVTVVVYPLNSSNTEYFTYKAKTYSPGIKGLAEKVIDATDAVHVAKITYDSFGKDIVGLVTNPVQLVKDKLRDNARSAFETPLLIQDAFSGFKSSEITPSPPEANIVAPTQKQPSPIGEGQKQPSKETKKDTTTTKVTEQKPPTEQKATRLTIKLVDQYDLPITEVNESEYCRTKLPSEVERAGAFHELGTSPTLLLIDSVGDKVPGFFARFDKNEDFFYGNSSPTSPRGEWTYDRDIVPGKYTLVFYKGGSTENSFTRRFYNSSEKQVSVSNSEGWFVKMTVSQIITHVFFEIHLKIVNQAGTPMDPGGYYNQAGDYVAGFVMKDKNGEDVRIDAKAVENGQYVIRGVSTWLGNWSYPPGDYILRVEKEGYAPVEKTIQIPDLSRISDDEIKLKRQDKIDLGTITLTKI